MFPPCLWHIYEQHCVFLQRLEERLSNWRWQGVLGDVFARFFDSNNVSLLHQEPNVWYLTHRGQVPHICISTISHYLNQCLHIVIWIPNSSDMLFKIQNFSLTKSHAVCKMADILSQPQCDNHMKDFFCILKIHVHLMIVSGCTNYVLIDVP